MDHLSIIATEPWGLAAMWLSGDFDARLVLVALLVMSLFSWYVIVAKLYDQHLWLRAARRAQNQVEGGGSVTELIQRLKQEESFRAIAEAGLRAASKYRGRLAERVSFHDWVVSSLARAVDREQNRVRKGLAFLPTIGLAAPAVGLVGTVYLLTSGLISYAQSTATLPIPKTAAEQPYMRSDKQDGASNEGSRLQESQGASGGETARDPSTSVDLDWAMQRHRQEHAGAIYGLVGEALLLLSIGVLIAIPAILGYRGLIARSKRVEETLRDFAAELTVRLLSGPLPPSTGGEGPDLAADATVAPVT